MERCGYFYTTRHTDSERAPPSIPTLEIHYPHLEKLWTYSYAGTKKRSVTAIAVNPVNSVGVLIYRWGGEGGEGDHVGGEVIM